jgi:hypothetical protein
MNERILFEVETPFGLRVSVGIASWRKVTLIKHPVMLGRESDVRDAIGLPDEVRASRIDPSVYLFYRLERSGRWLCAVVKKLNGNGFLITTYPTDAIKQGELIWSK